VEISFAVYGSVPLKTYLPDGDIDIALFQSSGPPVQGVWQEIVVSSLAHRRDNPSPTSLTITCIDVIEAEVCEISRDAGPVFTHPRFPCSHCLWLFLQVKLVKCIVDGLIVDISFNTFNGLCTLAFLEDVDRKIGLNHLFKRSIILVRLPSVAKKFTMTKRV
jgi:hypothetical protein